MDYVYAVYQEKSFSKAAQKLCMSQSALSLTIKHVEERIGIKIFDRSQNPIALTEFGKLYIKSAHEIINIARELENYAYDVNHLKRGHLSVGSGNFFAINLVAPAIALFKEKYQNVDIDLLEGRSADLEPELHRGNIDLLITNATLSSSTYSKTKLFTENLLLVVPRKFFVEPPCPELLLTQSDLCKKNILQISPISLKHFSKVPFIALRPGNDTKMRMDQIFAEHNVSPQILLELDQSSTAFALSCNNLGASIVSDTIIRHAGKCDNLLIYNLNGQYTQRDVSVFMKISDYIPTITKAFIDTLKHFDVVL